MKVAINVNFGGFRLKKDIAKKYGWDEWDVDRTDQKLIELIESGINVSADEPQLDDEDEDGDYRAIQVVNVPDEATDWKIIEYDGAEEIIYVLDGKMHYLDD